MRTLPAALSILAFFLAFAPAAATDVVTASGASPEILERVSVPDGVSALAIRTDGGLLAFAAPVDGPKGLTELVQTGGTPDTTRATRVRGEIRDLLFLADGRLLGLLFRPAKKWEGDTYLISWAPGAPKTERVMRVPPSSHALDHWPAGGGIVLACRNELRTLLEPDLRSGPVFMVPGSNLALTTMGASSFVWVGQEDGLFLVDLSAPSGREPMRILARQAVPSPVAQLVDYPDASTALVRLDDGRLYRAALDPPAFEPAGSADKILRLAKGPGEPPIAAAPPAPPEPETPAVAVAEPPAEEPAPEPAPVAPAEVREEPAPVGESPAVEVAEPAAEEPAPEPVRVAPAVPVVERPEPEPQPEPEPEIATEAPTPTPSEQPAAGPRYQLYGRISGSLALVRHVVLMGPDNILTEAARVRPDDRGRWGIERLAPGRYRVQVDGGGDRVLVADPRLVLVEVGTEPTEAPEIRVLRAF